MSVDLLEHFPAGCTPRPEQARLLAGLADALAEIADDRRAPRVLLVEAPPGVGKSHVAMTLARWSGDAYLLTSQKLLQDQYEREFGAELALVKGRDNYVCERYPAAAVPTSRGACRRPRGPDVVHPPPRPAESSLEAPLTREGHDPPEQRAQLAGALARLPFFLDAEDREWIVRYPAEPAAALSLVPLTVAAMAQSLLADC